MQFIKIDTHFVLRLIKGESIVDELVKFCEDKNIRSGIFTGIGAVESAEIGFYDLPRKNYIFKAFTAPHEIVSLTGNIALVENKPFIHAHTVISNDKFEAFGGHLKEGVVGATCEIYLIGFKESLDRKQDDEIGLKLLDCSIKSD